MSWNTEILKSMLYSRIFPIPARLGLAIMFLDNSLEIPQQRLKLASAI